MRRRTWLSWIVSFYVASCVLPAFNRAPGIVCLIWIPWVYFFPAWWANLPFFVGCSLLGGRHPWASRLCAILAALLAASLPLGLRAGDRVQVGYVVWLDRKSVV